jgi:hypothetical protein
MAKRPGQIPSKTDRRWILQFYLFELLPNRCISDKYR